MGLINTVKDLNQENRMDTPSTNRNEHQLARLLKVIKATLPLTPEITFQATVLAMFAALNGVDLPTTLTGIATGLSINALSNIIERIGGGEEVSDEEIVEKVKAAIQESQIKEHLHLNDMQSMIAKLFHKFDLFHYAIEQNEDEILRRITNQAEGYGDLLAELKSFREQNTTQLTRILQALEQLPVSYLGESALQFSTIRPKETINQQIISMFASGFELASIPSDSDFVDREDELSEAFNTLVKTHVLFLLGPAGIGKTSLMARIARELKANGKVVFWYSFTALSSPDELILQLANFLDRLSDQPLFTALLGTRYSTKQKVDIIIKALNGFNCTLCLDDYHVISQRIEIGDLIDYFIQNLGNCSVIVTSRLRPSFDSIISRINGDMDEIHLSGLNANQVRCYFERQNIVVTNELVNYITDDFGGLPITLKLVSTLLEKGYDSALLTENIKSNISQSIIDYLFEELWRFLDDSEKEALKLCALQFLPFSSERISKLTNRNDTKEALFQLEEKSLLRRLAIDWYLVHEIVKPIALSLSDNVKGTRDIIAHKLLESGPDYLDDFLEAAVQLYSIEDFNGAANVITEWFTEIQIPSYYEVVIDALIENLDEKKYLSGKIDQQVWLWLLNSKGHFYSQKQQWNKAKKIYQTMYELAQKISDKLALSVALQNLGVVSQLDEKNGLNVTEKAQETLAEEYYRNSLVIKKEIKDYLGQSQIHGNLGNLHMDHGDFSLAKNEFDLQRDLIDQAEVEDLHLLSNCANYGRLFAEQSKFDDAFAFYDQALLLADKYDLSADIAKLTYNLGHLYQDKEDYHQALSLYIKAYQIANDVNFWEIKEYAAIALGKTYQILGDYNKSIEYFEEVGERRKDIQDLAGLASIYFDISTFHYLNGDLERACDYITKGLSLFENIKSESQIDLFANNAYKIFCEANMQKFALKQFNFLRKRFKAVGSFSYYALLKVYEILGHTYLDLSMIIAADWCFNKVLEFSHKVSPDKILNYYGLVGGLFEKSEKFSLALSWYGKAVEKASCMGHKKAQAGMIYNIGNIYTQLEFWEDAENSYTSASLIAEDINDIELKELILHNQGYLARSQGNYNRAIDLLIRSLELSNQSDDVNSQITTLNNLGLTYQDADMFEEAQETFNNGLILARQTNQKYQEANLLISLGNLYSIINKLREGESSYQESLLLAQLIEDLEMEEKAVLSLAYLYKREGRFCEIEEMVQKVANKASEFSQYTQLADFAILFGEVAIEEKNYELAAHNFSQGLLASYASTAENFLGNEDIDSSFFLQNFLDVLSAILRSVKILINANRAKEAKEFCSKLVKDISDNKTFPHWENEPATQTLEKIISYFERTLNPSFEELIQYIN